MRRISGSFRDRSGYVYDAGDYIIRTINENFKPHWECGVASMFLQRLVEKKQLLSFSEQEPLSGAWKSLRVERVPFISYPYEWCFSQLKDGALLTLELQKEALAHGMVLKDASAFNVQFLGASAIFIDLLSFEKWKQGLPWQAYKQFCSHFLAPLALICHTDVQCGCMSRLWIDGIPLSLSSKLLPFKTLFSLGLLWNLHLHARMQTKYADTQVSASKVRNVKVSTSTLTGIATLLENTIKRLKLPYTKTEWSQYYENTNYTDAATEAKLRLVDKVASNVRNTRISRMAVDLGANTGRYSRCLAPYFDYVLAPDIDPVAVEYHYSELKKNGVRNILPLVLDLANTSPGLGWACGERDSFASRCKADMLNALALIHHLVISAGIPLRLIADYISALMEPGGYLLIEFVPKEDSQVQRMLATREDVFDDYTLDGFKNAFFEAFDIEESLPIPETVRTLCVMRKRG